MMELPELPPHWKRHLVLCDHLEFISHRKDDSLWTVVGKSKTYIEVYRWGYITTKYKDCIRTWFHNWKYGRQEPITLELEVEVEEKERESETMIKAEEIAEVLTDNLRYVEVNFPNTIDKSYVYKVPNDVGVLSVGDKVVVMTDYNKEGTTHIVEVVAVYPNYTSVPSDKKRVKITKYIVNKIDFSPYSAAIKLEKEIVSFVETKQREAIRNQLRAAVTAEFPELLKFAQLEAPKPTETT